MEIPETFTHESERSHDKSSDPTVEGLGFNVYGFPKS